VLGAQLAALGINVDFAPVLDVDTNPDNPVIGDRSFGRDAETVITHALAFARGLAARGVASCGKHFPGHGDTDLDSHLALPRIAHDRARLDAVELAPFRAARGLVPSIMTAHVVFDALDPGVPATLSRRVITGLLREELGYDGVIVSDDLEMKAVFDRWGVAESAVRAIEAGCDLLLVCSRLELVEEAAEALVARASTDPSFAHRLTEAAARVDRLRAQVPSRPRTGDALARMLGDPDVAALEAELAR
jgi:beta-N-acetylhexosaminidase